MATFAVILPAAGKSTRFASENDFAPGGQSFNSQKKPFVELSGRAIWLRAAELFANRDDVVQTIIVIAPDDIEWFKEKFRPNLAFMDIEIVAGGAERADSVRNGLDQVRADVDFVAVHDAARPLLVGEWIDAVFQAAEKSGAAIPAMPLASTIKRVSEDSSIVETVPRQGLWAAQTPQVFARQLLLDAFEKQGNMQATDEAQLVENMGHAVSVIEGWPMNFKITTAADLQMAKVVVGALPKKTLRALHPFADEEPRFL
jgi:2-C-methyl-D-erythritol 4-phosphate cytidylyltransferase